MSVRLHLVVEGQTEKRFVDTVLVPHLAAHGVFSDARCVLTGRDGPYWHRGGLLGYDRARRDLVMWMGQERANADVYFSTMFDLYALPGSFPGREHADGLRDPYDKVRTIEEAFRADVDCPRFLPYIQLHEFEALVLVDPGQLSIEFMERDEAIAKLANAVKGVEPERIDDGSETSPSKRIASFIPEYASRKSSAGPRVAREIGLSRLREACPHFNEWITQLEMLAR